MMKLNLINKLIKKTRHWNKKTTLAFFRKATLQLENKKKEALFSVIDRLDVKPEVSVKRHNTSSRIVWICWFQGVDSAPELVKRCIESVQRHATDAQVILLNDENIPQYLDLPQHIKKKYASGHISKAQYSDIIRTSLLYEYGGVWMDATVFMTKSLPESFYENEFSSLRFENDENALSQGFWTAYFLASRKGCILTKFVRDILYRYWLHHDTLIEYFLIDYSFLYARERYPLFHQIMNEQPITGNNRFLIRQYINVAPDNASIDILNQDPVGIYKLSHKEKYSLSDSGQPTLYRKILDGSFRLQ